uniref:Uncharacterized protein n=1 Tax=Rhizophagus irregularis (strain DAOM 181602 / DAOM 197198 / MUCL 43194) TaxID=747089 RepID=U9TME9_RHIID
MEKVEKIEKVDGKVDVLIELCESLKRDYEETFIVTDNGTISASNDNIRKYVYNNY